MTQGDCQTLFLLSCNVPNKSFSGDYVDRQKLSLQKELNKAWAEDAELRAEELSLIEKCSRLNEKRWTLLLHEF